MATNCENLSPGTVNTIIKQLRELQAAPAEGIRVFMNEENIADVHAEVDGPVDTPFFGGVFKMRLVLPSDYPNTPPKGKCTTNHKIIRLTITAIMLQC